LTHGHLNLLADFSITSAQLSICVRRLFCGKKVDAL
jgi:hypothetical protein